MCGIAGYYHFNNKVESSISVINDMISQMTHRGPDGSGIYIADQIALGHTRLSIIDLDSGSQPMSINLGNQWIIFNGEIYNYVELKKELILHGCKFKTKSDTEVLLHAYDVFGINCLEKLNGQFAFAIWDKSKKELFLARDRIGIRPLFYSTISGCFVFSSEIKAMLEYPDILAELSPTALSEIFMFWSPISPRTAIENIFELPPGKYLKVNKNGISIESYWSLSFPASGEHTKKTLESAIEEFESLFTDAIQLRLRADVPVGAYLSGGIDSSITTYFINKYFPSQLKTFSIGFEDDDYDESDFQQLAVRNLKTENHTIQCNLSDIAKIFPSVIWHTEIPILRTAPAPMFLLSEHVNNNNYKVVVTGEGADEILAGYNIFKEMRIRRFWARYPKSSFRPILLRKLYPYLSHLQDQNTNQLKVFFGYKLTETNSPYYSHLLRWNNTSRIQHYFSDLYWDHIKDQRPLNQLGDLLPKGFEQFDSLSKAQWIESTLFMSGYLLSSQGDRMAMANSVEGRYPFLDHRIIEYCTELSPDFKLDGLQEKKLLKKMMVGKLPEKIISRPKQAYRAPSSASFVSGRQRYLREVVSSEQVKNMGIFNPLLVKKLWTKMKLGKNISETDNMALTGIISTQIFYNQFINGKMRPKRRFGLTDLKIIDERENIQNYNTSNIYYS